MLSGSRVAGLGAAWGRQGLPTTSTRTRWVTEQGEAGPESGDEKPGSIRPAKRALVSPPKPHLKEKKVWDGNAFAA